MVSRTSDAVDDPKPSDGTPSKDRRAKGPSSPTKREEKPKAKDVAELKDYQLGNCLGKGAFGSVYRALNWGTGETVAVKQIRLADLPKSELRVIMLEIDLLKNLDHPNIVKYQGFVKTPETLNIILEYVEDPNISQVLITRQVLHGLVYLHEQGVIHRDIKGANILTTKHGLVKLADFGVASRTTGLHESSVVGTPYWMAPEVIDLSGASPASDIWSLGATVVELLDGKPPYHKLQAMQALFRIVNDDHPPLPSGASPTVVDFLMQCFQKDPNLRVSAKKLLKHPWIVNAKRVDAVVPKKPTQYEEAVKSVQEWNNALKSPPAGPVTKNGRLESSSPDPIHPLKTPINKSFTVADSRPDNFRYPQGLADDNWDDDFASAISPSALQLPHLRPHDNFGGLLSSDKLKAFASIDSVTEHETYTDEELTLRSPMQPSESDVFQTVRPAPLKTTSPKKHSKAKSEPKPKRKTSLPSARNVTNLQKSKPPNKPINTPRPTKLYRESSVEDFSDLVADNEDVFKLGSVQKENIEPPKILDSPSVTDLIKSMRPSKLNGSLRRQATPKGKISMRRTRSSIEIQKFAENEDDEDFSDIFVTNQKIVEKSDSEDGSEPNTLMLTSKVSNHSWLGDGDDEDDPFAQLEEGVAEMDLETNIARDKHARLRTEVESLVGQLKVAQDDNVLIQISEDLMSIFPVFPDTKGVIVGTHGMLPILEILETCFRLDIILNLLKIVNAIIFKDTEVQENLCFVGGIPKINKFASKKFPREIRLEAAAFVRQMYTTSTLTLQMFVSAGGLNVLVDFLEDDYDDDRELVLIGVNGIFSVFELQGSTPKNDFCRILSRNSVLEPLSLVLNRVLSEDREHGEQRELAELCEARIANIFFIFSQAENYVKELVAERTVLHRVLKDLKKMSPPHQITMLKFIKNLSMLSTTLEALHNSNAIDVLTDLLSSGMNQTHFRELSNQILNTIYNLCRLSKRRQEDAALDGIIPLLIKIVKQERPLKEFALPILCDMAHSSKAARRELWRNKGLQFYISLLSDPYWQVTALDAIFTWLQEETAKVEDHLLHDRLFTHAITASFTHSKSHYFENLLDPLQKLLRLSPQLAASMAGSPEFFSCIAQKLSTQKPAVRVNLLRIMRDICDASEDGGGLLVKMGLRETIKDLELNDSAVLVRNMAQELVRSCEESETNFLNSGGKKRATASSVASSVSSGTGYGMSMGMRRTSSSNTPPHLLERQMSKSSMPPSPGVERQQNHLHHRSSISYFDHAGNLSQGVEMRIAQTPRRTRVGVNGSAQPASKDGTSSPAYHLSRANTSTSNYSGGRGGNTEAASVGKSRLPRTSTTNSTASSRARPTVSTRHSVIGDLAETERNRASPSPNGRLTPNNLSTPRREREKESQRDHNRRTRDAIAATTSRRVQRRQTSAGETAWK
ncbi:MAG: hypothetical protein Q9227_006609 [Pyrenula ochraceoflavens]